MSQPGAAAAAGARADALSPSPAPGAPDGGSGSGSGGGGDELPALTRADVAALAAREALLLVIIDDGVYDVGDFSHRHPGGKAMIDAFAGRDGTDTFHSIHSHHPTSKARAILDTLKVARLAPTKAAGAAPAPAPAASPAGGSSGR